MNEKRTWTLDSPINRDYDVIIKIKSLLTDLTDFSGEYTTPGSTVANLGFASADTQSNKNVVKNIEVNEFVYILWGGSYDGIVRDENDNEIAKVNYETGQIEFYIRTDPPIDGEDNIEVEFVPEDITYYEDNPIGQCKFGIQFGVEGYKDRLFLSGNPNYPNKVYYSEFDDFTYFPFTNTHDLGSDNNPVIAFSRLSDSTVAIHKVNDNTDPTIYYMTYSINENYEQQGIEKYSFPIVAGVIGESPVNNNTCFNLSNDNLFLSNNGVFGIELNENIKSNERYALERSGFINSMLTKHNDLDKAKAIVYKNRYYLAIDDVVFVADARLKSSARTGDMKDTFNYEWFYWTNISVQQWFILNDELYFLTPTGKLNKFYAGYEDIETYKLNSGCITTYETRTDLFQFNEKYEHLFKDGNEIEFTVYDGNPVLATIHNVDKYRSTFQLKDKETGLDLYYDAPYLNQEFYVYDKKNVESVWQTPILSLGTTIHSKNLLSSTLVCEPSIEGTFDYGYITNNNKANINTSLLAENGFDFTNFDFTQFSFKEFLARSRTIKTRVRNFCFIQFVIKSSDNNDCAVNNFTITYNIGRKNKGVR